MQATAGRLHQHGGLQLRRLALRARWRLHLSAADQRGPVRALHLRRALSSSQSGAMRSYGGATRAPVASGSAWAHAAGG